MNNKINKIGIIAIIFIISSYIFVANYFDNNSLTIAINNNQEKLNQDIKKDNPIPSLDNNGEKIESFPMDELGFKAQGQMNSDSFLVQRIDNDIILKSDLQKLKGIITEEGLNIESTHKDEKDLFSIKSSKLYRKNDDNNTNNNQSIDLKTTGKTSVNNNNNLAILKKQNIQEEFTTSGDGIRQDFIINQKPDGQGKLILSLDVTGASISQTQDNQVTLTLNKSQRELIYQDLKVTDTNNQTLIARFININNNQIEIEVDDQGATYPIRIDPTITDSNWVSMGAYGGVNGVINTFALDSLDNLYIGGNFYNIGDKIVNNVAKWDGSTWSALGGGVGEGPYPLVSSIFFDSLDNLYVGGRFIEAGEVTVSNIAKWDGSTWSTLEGGVGGGSYPVVYSLDFDSLGNLYVGGSFIEAGEVTANNIAKWDGSSWSALGSGLNSYSKNIKIDENDNVYVGGGFTSASGTSASLVAKWDGSTWSALGGGIGGSYPSVNSIDFDSLGNLYVGGNFTSASGTSASRIAKWDGSTWSALGSGLNSYVFSLAVDSSDDIYVGGYFTTAGGVSANRIAKWDGSSWSTFGSGADLHVASLFIDSSDNVFAGGYFSKINNISTGHIAKWNNIAWEPVGFNNTNGFDGTIRNIAFDSGNNLYIGGEFINIDGIMANRIAKWDGSSWSALGSGVNNQVWSIDIDQNDNVYAGGYFTIAGGVSVNRIAKWDGVNWSALGGGMNNLVEKVVIDSNGNIYAGGDFSTASGTTVNRIAKWDGNTWSSLGGGVASGFLIDMIFDDNDNLYVSGSFSTIGGVSASRIAKWDGSSWSALGSGVNNFVEIIALDSNNNLYAIGWFTSAGGEPVNYIAKWDGSTWSALGSGLNVYGMALAIDSNDNVYAGGHFTEAGGVSASYIAKWDGSSWSALGSGVNSYVRTLSIDPFDNLYIGGNFTLAGGKLSSYFAKCMTALHSLTYSAGLNGNVSGFLSQSVGYLSSGSVVTAVADDGYRFVGWSDGSTDNLRIDTSVISDVTVVANFEVIPNSSNINIILPPSSGAGGKTKDVGMDKTINLETINEAGTNLLGYVNSKANFGIEISKKQATQNYTLEIKNLDLINNKVTIIIYSDPITLDLELDESKEIDLDNDGVNDLLIKFQDIYVNRVELGLFKIISIERENKEINDIDEEEKAILTQLELKENNYINEQLNEEPVPLTPNITIELEESTSTDNKEFKKPQTKIEIKISMRKGSNNQQVKDLETILKEMEYLPEDHNPNEYYDQVTEEAVNQFQKDHGINPCGEVGPRTARALNSENYYTNKEFRFTRDLRYNDTGEDVKQLQTRLKDRNYFPFYVKPTYWFGPITQTAVYDFQKVYSIDEKGVVGKKSRKELNKSY